MFGKKWFPNRLSAVLKEFPGLPETRQPSQNWGTDIIRNGLRRQNRSISAPLSGHFTPAMTSIAYKVLKTKRRWRSLWNHWIYFIPYETAMFWSSRILWSLTWSRLDASCPRSAGQIHHGARRMVFRINQHTFSEKSKKVGKRCQSKNKKAGNRLTMRLPAFLRSEWRDLNSRPLGPELTFSSFAHVQSVKKIALQWGFLAFCFSPISCVSVRFWPNKPQINPTNSA